MLQTFPEHLLCLWQLDAGLNTGNTISEQLKGLDVNRSRIYILWQTWPWFIPCKVALPFGSLSNLRGVTFLFEIIFSLLKMALPHYFTFFDIYPWCYFFDKPMLALENPSTSLPPTCGDFQIKKKSNGYATSTALTRRQGDFDQGRAPEAQLLGGGVGPASLSPNDNLSIGH